MDQLIEDRGMLHMPILAHLEELRSRTLRALWGFVAAFLICMMESDRLWRIVMAPAQNALQKIGVAGEIVIINPMDGFSIIWVWSPAVASIFLASPWILWQAWAFIAPGLYRRERRLAAPFILCVAGLFIAGGLFAYFVAFRYCLAFLFGIGAAVGVRPMISVDGYFDLFVKVVLGISVTFELPVVVFFLTLLRLASPRFLLENSRYAIMAILTVAAFVTPSQDAFNLMVFAVPMCLLFFLGIFASYLLVLKRDRLCFPWGPFLRWLFVSFAIVAGCVWFVVTRYHFHLTWHWPFLAK